jgi:RNA polymerase sigma factor (TIGR02999 family)
MAALPEEITQLLMSWNQGDKAALDQLVPLVYSELRRLAKRHMNREDPAHTLQTSALINEAYLKLIDQQNVPWQNRAHFFAVAAQVMRHILIDHARRHAYDKRGAGAQHIPLDEAAIVQQGRAAQLVALDEALDALAVLDPRRSQIIELRFFGGLNGEEISEVMEISPSTVQREWRAAKAWLHHTMTTGQQS